MIVLMGLAYSSMALFLVPEVKGIFNGAPEDTYTEWVADLPLWAVLSISALHLVAGVLLVWSAGHFLEWYFARRGA